MIDAGRAIQQALDDVRMLDLVELWHNTDTTEERSLYNFMGMTWPEYAAWVEGRR